MMMKMDDIFTDINNNINYKKRMMEKKTTKKTH